MWPWYSGHCFTRGRCVLTLKKMMMMTQGLSLGALAPCQVAQTLPGRVKILPCSLLASTQQQLRRSGAPANLHRCVLFDFLRNVTYRRWASFGYLLLFATLYYSDWRGWNFCVSANVSEDARIIPGIFGGNLELAWIIEAHREWPIWRPHRSPNYGVDYWACLQLLTIFEHSSQFVINTWCLFGVCSWICI